MSIEMIKVYGNDERYNSDFGEIVDNLSYGIIQEIRADTIRKISISDSNYNKVSITYKNGNNEILGEFRYGRLLYNSLISQYNEYLKYAKDKEEGINLLKIEGKYSFSRGSIAMAFIDDEDERTIQVHLNNGNIINVSFKKNATKKYVIEVLDEINIFMNQLK